MSIQRIAVIGGVASGPAAAAQAARTDEEADVFLFEQGPSISYGACEIPYYVADEIESAATLVQYTPARFEETRNVHVRANTVVREIHPTRNRLVVESPGRNVTEERFDKFVLATGAVSRPIDLPGADAPNVFHVRTLTGAIDLKNHLSGHRVRHAVVVGGGYIGVEMADALTQRGIRVTILEPGAGVLHRYLSAALQPVVEQYFVAAGIQIRSERAIALDIDAAGYVSAVSTDRGERIGCQLVIVAIGVTPNVCLARDADIRLTDFGSVDVDEHMRTSLPNVWACGDCVQVERVVDRKSIYLPLSPTAFRTAHVAGENAARRGRGAQARFPGVVGSSAVKAFGLEVAKVGLSVEEAVAAGYDSFTESVKGWSRVSFYPGARRLHVELVVDRSRGRLLGGSLVGEEGAAMRANVLVPLVKREWTVREMRDLDLIYTPPLAPAIDPLLVAANRAANRL